MLCVLYSAGRMEDVARDDGEGCVSGCVNCNQTSSDGCEGTKQPPTEDEETDETDELDNVVLQLGRSMKELVLGIVKTVNEAIEDN